MWGNASVKDGSIPPYCSQIRRLGHKKPAGSHNPAGMAVMTTFSVRVSIHPWKIQNPQAYQILSHPA